MSLGAFFFLFFSSFGAAGAAALVLCGFAALQPDSPPQLLSQPLLHRNRGDGGDVRSRCRSCSRNRTTTSLRNRRTSSSFSSQPQSFFSSQQDDIAAASHRDGGTSRRGCRCCRGCHGYRRSSAAVAAAAAVAEGVRLRFETDQNDGHCRQSQYHLQYIALHQNTSKHMDKKLERSTVCVIARWTTNEDRRSC